MASERPIPPPASKSRPCLFVRGRLKRVEGAAARRGEGRKKAHVAVFEDALWHRHHNCIGHELLPVGRQDPHPSAAAAAAAASTGAAPLNLAHQLPVQDRTRS